MKTDGDYQARRLMVFGVAVAFRAAAMARVDSALQGTNATKAMDEAEAFVAMAEARGLLKFDLLPGAAP